MEEPVKLQKGDEIVELLPHDVRRREKLMRAGYVWLNPPASKEDAPRRKGKVEVSEEPDAADE